MFLQCKRSKLNRFHFCQMVDYSPTKLTIILSIVFIINVVSVLCAPLDNVQNVTIEIESKSFQYLCAPIMIFEIHSKYELY